MSAITKEFTKEQLQQIEAAAKEVLWPVVWSENKARKHFSEKITPEVVLGLARIALASLEAEAVADVVAWSSPNEERTCDVRLRRHDIKPGPLYTATPAPVSVPDVVSWEDVPDEITEDDMEVALAWAHGFNQCRDAMLQGAEHVTTTYKLRDAVETILNSGIAIDAEKILEERDALNTPDCWCLTCRPVKLNDMRFVVCPDCGNKRCPHANDHRKSCTGSNEPGQEGSAYPAAPQQEVKP